MRPNRNRHGGERAALAKRVVEPENHAAALGTAGGLHAFATTQPVGVLPEFLRFVENGFAEHPRGNFLEQCGGVRVVA
jgi:hypothetical protein